MTTPPIVSAQEWDAALAKMLEKEKLRKERINGAREKEDQERRAKREEKERLKDERLREMQQSEELNRQKLIQKQIDIADKLKHLTEQKEEEKTNKAAVNSEKARIKIKLREESTQVLTWIKKTLSSE